MQKKLLTFSLLLNFLFIITGGILAYQFRLKLYRYLFPVKSKNILLIGDSLIAQENWSLLLGRNDVYSIAYGGAITLHILKNLTLQVPQIKPKICVIEGGINDLLAGVPEQRIFENYQKMIKILQEQQIKIVVQAVVYTSMSDINKEITLLNNKLTRFCQENQLVFVDANSYLAENNQLKTQYSLDGIHLQYDAYPIWAKELAGALETLEDKP
ncbi:GDSL-type esterase/lipase family protein [Arcicella aquatica]|uniref:GDSL-type esterase/lipase family protein n=1 Tax=Arcicella aquatica TaxID=217141 RepID=A0ABU5QP71_9BACT|nr:GDSL-type esterase/lipase family protein [Arcicella aquatica]MEA5258881.1 GDSL-type esterase/lipase family protein [Arcicella aquatica]